MVTFNDIIKSFQKPIINYNGEPNEAFSYNTRLIENFNCFNDNIWEGLQIDNTWLYDIDKLHHSNSKASWKNRCLTKIVGDDVTSNIDINSAIEKFISLYYSGTDYTTNPKGFILYSDLELENPFLGDDNENAIITSDLNWDFKIYKLWSYDHMSILEIVVNNSSLSTVLKTYQFSISIHDTILLEQDYSDSVFCYVYFEKDIFLATKSVDEEFTVTFRIPNTYNINEERCVAFVAGYDSHKLVSNIKDGNYNILTFNIPYWELLQGKLSLTYEVDVMAFKNYDEIRVLGLNSKTLVDLSNSETDLTLANNYCILINKNDIISESPEKIDSAKKAFSFNVINNQILFNKSVYDEMIKQASTNCFLVLSFKMRTNYIFEVFYAFDGTYKIENLNPHQAFLNISSAFSNNYISIKTRQDGKSGEDAVYLQLNGVHNVDRNENVIVGGNKKYFAILPQFIRVLYVTTAIQVAGSCTLNYWSIPKAKTIQQTMKITGNYSYTQIFYNDLKNYFDVIYDFGVSRADCLYNSNNWIGPEMEITY